MALRLALFEFVNEDNALEIGDSSRITGVRKDQLNNERWDNDTICEVRWPGRNGRIDNVPAKVLRFGDERSELKAILDRLLNGEELLEILDSIGKLGRGQRIRRTARRVSLSSDEENELPTAKRQKKSKAASEKHAERDILNILREKNQQKKVDQAGESHVDDLRTEVRELKKAVLELQEANQSLLEVNRSLVSTVQSLAGLPSAVEKLTSLIATAGLPHTTPRLPPRQPSTPPRLPMMTSVPASPTLEPTPEPLVQEQEDSTFSIPPTLLARVTRSDPRKMTNELLHGLYTEEFLATHSVSGGKRAGGLASKPAMDRDEVSQITKTVQRYFPEKKPADVHYFMREKLNNAAKNMKRKADRLVE